METMTKCCSSDSEDRLMLVGLDCTTLYMLLQNHQPSSSVSAHLMQENS